MISLLRWKASLLSLTHPNILNFIFIPLYLQNSSRRYHIHGLHYNIWLESGSTPTQKNAVKPTSYIISLLYKRKQFDFSSCLGKEGKPLPGSTTYCMGCSLSITSPGPVSMYCLTVHTTTSIGLSQHSLLLSPALFSPEFLTVHNVV